MCYVDPEILPNGDLKLRLLDADQCDRDVILAQPWISAFCDLTAPLRERGTGWDIVDPAEIGDLTDAPMLSDDVTVEDDGTRVVYGSVWYFPRYQIEDPIETLLDHGEVIFELGHKPGEVVQQKYQKGRYGGDPGAIRTHCASCGAELQVSAFGMYCPNCGPV